MTTVVSENLPVVPDTISDALHKTDQVFDSDVVSIAGHPASDRETDESAVSDTESDASKASARAAELPPAQPDQSATSDFKYASHEAAERGAREAEQRMHQASEEAKWAREAAERMERRVVELEAQIKTTAQAPSQPAADTVEILAQVLQELGAYEAPDPDDQAGMQAYYKKLAKGWDGALGPVIRKVAEELLERTLEGRLKHERETISAEQTKQQEEQRWIGYAVEEAKKQGLDLTGNPRDNRLFWQVAAVEADEELPDGGYQAKIDLAVTKAAEIKRTPASNGGSPPSREEVQRNRAHNQPMTRAGGGPPGAPTTTGVETTVPAQPLSIDQAVTQTHGRRRI